MHIAASTYLNSAPLVYSFSTGTQRDRVDFLGHEAPSRCAALLRSGACDAALIPVIEYQRQPGLRIVPDVAVASKGRVRSVVLIARRPMPEARRVSLDAASRTSQALVQILCRYRYQSTPVLIERGPDAPAPATADALLGTADAALAIGDPAIRLAADAADSGLLIYDLAEEWRTLTGRPFVFAVWAVRPGVSLAIDSGAASAARPGTDVPDFVAARREGVAHIDEIAARYAEEAGFPIEDVRHYLRENVNYELDADNLAGLREYFRLAHACGIVDDERELSFI